MTRGFLGNTYHVALRWITPSGMSDVVVSYYSYNEDDNNYSRLLEMAKAGKCRILTIEQIAVFDTASGLETESTIIKA